VSELKPRQLLRAAPVWFCLFNSASAYAHGWAATLLANKAQAEWCSNVSTYQTCVATLGLFCCIPWAIGAYERWSQ
jgi:hypothetical protein